jgi:hypothetical protein
MSELSGSQLAAGILQDEEENVASPRPGVLPFMQPVVNGNHDATGRELGVVPPVADTAITDILDADEGDLNTKIALNFVNAEM